MGSLDIPIHEDWAPVRRDADHIVFAPIDKNTFSNYKCQYATKWAHTEGWGINL